MENKELYRKAGKLLSAEITDIKERSQHFKQISISIYLVNF